MVGTEFAGYAELMKPTFAELQQTWFKETYSINDSFYDWRAAECADIPDEISDLLYDAENESRFWPDFHEWNGYLEDNCLRLALEQSTHNGLLLDDDMRATRLVTCPPVMLNKLRFFLEHCPCAVDDYLTFLNSHLVRIERARRTGSPDWRPFYRGLSL